MKTVFDFEWTSSQGNEFSVMVEHDYDPGYWNGLRGDGCPPSSEYDWDVTGDTRITDEENEELEIYLEQNMDRLLEEHSVDERYEDEYEEEYV